MACPPVAADDDDWCSKARPAGAASTVVGKLSSQLLPDVLSMESCERQSRGGHTNNGFSRGTSGGDLTLLMTCNTSAMLGRSHGLGFVQANPSSSTSLASSATPSSPAARSKANINSIEQLPLPMKSPYPIL
nr:unnamed protein product [Digitaria exilis]